MNDKESAVSETLLSDIRRMPMIKPLGNDYWQFGGYGQRSRELTPLYAERYVGPRTSGVPDSHTFWELTFVFQGKGELRGEATFAMRPNTAFLTPPGTPHWEYAGGHLDTLWVGLAGSLLNTLPAGNVLVVQKSDIAPLCEQLWLHALQPNDVGLEMDGALRTIAGRFLRLFAQPSRHDGTLRSQVLTFIHQNLARQFTVAELAAEHGLSEGYFYKWFKSEMKATPIAYVTQQRVKSSLYLLQFSTMSVKRVASLVGYDDPLYFSRVFKQVMGYAPSDSRGLEQSHDKPARGE